MINRDRQKRFVRFWAYLELKKFITENPNALLHGARTQAFIELSALKVYKRLAYYTEIGRFEK